MGDDDIGIPDEHLASSDAAPSGAPEPVDENSWLGANVLAEILEAQQKVLENKGLALSEEIAVAAQAANACRSQAMAAAALSEQIARESVACLQAQAALDFAGGILSAVSAALPIGGGPASFASNIVAAHDPRLVAKEGAGPAGSPAGNAPAMVWRTYAAKSFFDLATRAGRFVASMPAMRSIAATLTSASALFQAPPAAGAPGAKAPASPAQSMRSLAQASRAAGADLRTEGFSSPVSGVFTTAANLLDQAALPAPGHAAKAPGEIEAAWDAVHTLLTEISKSSLRPAKPSGVDSFKGVPSGAMPLAPGAGPASLKAVGALAAQLLQIHVDTALPALSVAQKAAAALSELAIGLQGNALGSPAKTPAPPSPTPGPAKSPTPATIGTGAQKTIEVAAMNALARSASIGVAGPGGKKPLGLAASPPTAMPPAALARAITLPSLGGPLGGAPPPGGSAPSAPSGAPLPGASPPGPAPASDAAIAMDARADELHPLALAPDEPSGAPANPTAPPPSLPPIDLAMGGPPSASQPPATPLLSPPPASADFLSPMLGALSPLSMTPQNAIAPFAPMIGPASNTLSPAPSVFFSMLPAAQQGGAMGMDFPDIAMVPGPVGVPIPYPNIAANALAAPFSPSILLTGMPALGMPNPGIPPAAPAVPQATAPAAQLPAIQRLPRAGNAPAPHPSASAKEDPEANPAAFRDELIEEGGPGAVPDSSMRRQLEPHLGFDPIGARLHTGPEASDAAFQVQAQAFTIGRDVFFGQGRYAPDTREGMSLIGHELTHVGQQTDALGARVQRFPERVGNEMEQEARQVAMRFFEHHVGALQVDEYVCDFVSDVGKFGSDEDRRLERLSVEAFEMAEKKLAHWHGEIGMLVVNLTISPEEMSDTLIVQRWSDAIVGCVKSAVPSARPPHGAATRVQKFDSFEHVQLGDEGAGKARKFKIKEQRDRDGMDPAERDSEYESILHHSEPPAYVKEEKTADGKHVYEERRPAFLKEGLTYGEVVALSGDHFGSFDELDKADLAMVARLIPLIHSSKTKAIEWAKANPNFLTLALENASHFSDPSNPVNNLSTYRKMHLRALLEPNTSRALMMNAAADHFLTDAFSSGHMRVPRGTLDKALAVPSTLLVGLTGIGAMVGAVLGGMAAHESGDSVLAGMLKGILTGFKESPHVLGGAASMALHDHDNEHGLQVENELGQKWKAYGDDNLNPGAGDSDEVKANKELNNSIALKAVMSSQQEVKNMMLSSGKRKTEPPKPPYAAEKFIPTPKEGYVQEAHHAAASGLSSVRDWMYDKAASIGQQIESIIQHVRKMSGDAMDTAKTAAIEMLQKAKKKAEELEASARDAVWGGKDAQEYVLTHESELAGLSLERKREIMTKLARRLVSAKDREAVAVLYRATTGAQRDALSMEFGAQFSESAYSVRSTVALVRPPSDTEIAALKKKGQFNPAEELMGLAEFQRQTGFGWFGMGRAEGLVLIDKMLAALQSLGNVTFGKKTRTKQGEAMVLVTRLSDVLTAYLDQLGSTLPADQRLAMVNLLTKLNAWKAALHELVPAAAIGKGLAAMDKDTKGAVEKAAQYAGSFQGTADSAFRHVGDIIDRALFRPYTSMEGSFSLKIPVEEFFVGFELKLTAEREEHVKVGIEAGTLGGIGAEAGEYEAALSAYQGTYIESQAKTGGEALSLFSYGMYHSLRESPVPKFIPSYMWGGGSGNDAEAYRRAESWSAATEMEIFAPLAKRLAEAKNDKEREEIEEEIQSTYVEVGEAAELRGEAKAGGTGVKASIGAQSGTRYDLDSIQAAQGGLGGRFIARYLGDSFLTLGRKTNKVKLASGFEVEPFEYEGEFEVSHTGSDAAGEGSEWGVGLDLSAGMQLKFEEMAAYAKTFSAAAPKMIAWAADVAAQYPNAGPAALEIGDLAGEIARGMGEGVSSVLEFIAPVGDKFGLGPKLTLKGHGAIEGGSPEGSVQLLVAEAPKVEAGVAEGEIKVETMAAGVKFDKSGVHKM